MYTFGVFRRFQFHKLQMLPDDVFWGDMNQGLPGMRDQEFPGEIAALQWWLVVAHKLLSVLESGSDNKPCGWENPTKTIYSKQNSLEVHNICACFNGLILVKIEEDIQKQNRLEQGSKNLKFERRTVRWLFEILGEGIF